MEKLDQVYRILLGLGLLIFGVELVAILFHLSVASGLQIGLIGVIAIASILAIIYTGLEIKENEIK
ncbi:hypothetical protein lbkm_0579 [Lachnospiraceae bacterium KM106-2]|nr:hypothetical protein lbkm_0579 [Lachnospiraceae bacterium KM106-2]